MTPATEATEFGPPGADPVPPAPPHGVIEAAACYFMVTLTLGWLLGPVRQFWERSGADPLLTRLSQAVATLLALVWAAGWVVSVFDVPDRTSLRLAVGLGAIGTLFACDALAAYLEFGVTPLAFVAHFATPAGAAVGLSYLIAALLPSLRHRGRSS